MCNCLDWQLTAACVASGPRKTTRPGFGVLVRWPG